MSEVWLLRLRLFARAGWEMVCAFGPYVLVGALAGGILEAGGFGRSRALARRIARLRAIPSVLAAAALGLASPFCTYGTVPIVAALARGGLPPAAAAAFLAASSLMNPQLFAVTAGGLGMRIALARLAGAVRTLVPPGWIRSAVGADRPYAVALSSLLGVPFYACGGAAVPVLRELELQGVPAGAILAFLWSGPATRITALAALLALFRTRFVAAYALYVLVLAFLLGEALRATGAVLS